MSETVITATKENSLIRAWSIVLISGLFFFYEFIQLTMFDTLSPFMMQEFSISAEAVSDISSWYFLAEISLLFIAGIIIDRVSTKRLILTFMTLCVSATFVFAASQTLWVAELCRFIEGLGAAFCFMCSLKLASNWLPERQLALASGLLVTMAMMGGHVSHEPLGHLIDSLGSWRQGIQYLGYLGIAIILLIAFFVQDANNADLKQSLDLKSIDKKEELAKIKTALRNHQNWLAGLYTCLVNLPIFIIGSLFGTLYLTQAHGLSPDQARVISSLVFWGTIFGSPFFGLLSDRIGLRKAPMIVGAVLSLATMLLIMYLPSPGYSLLFTLFFALGFITSSQTITYPLISESNPTQITGTSLGIASTIIMSGGLLQPVFGKLLQRHWDGTVIDGVAQYSLSDYNGAFLMLPIAFLLSIAISFMLKETYCQSHES